MKTTKAVQDLLAKQGHFVAPEVSSQLYQRFLTEIHEGDYRDVLSDLQEEELALYMAATCVAPKVQTPSSNAVVYMYPFEELVETVKKLEARVAALEEPWYRRLYAFFWEVRK
jgi:hypothetical protein